MAIRMHMPPLTSVRGQTLLTDNKPYLFRQSPVVAEMLDDMLTGGTVAWNQLWKTPTNSASKTENGVTITDNRDGTFTVSTDANGATANTYRSTQNIQVITGHKYFWGSIPQGGSSSTFYSYITGNVEGHTDYGRGTIMVATGTGSTWTVEVYVKTGTVITTPIKVTPKCIDLTLMYGSTIADYVYSLETQTAGSGIAWLQSYGFFTKDYYPYDAGSLLSVKTSGHKTVGKNLLDLSQWTYEQNSGFSVNGDTILLINSGYQENKNSYTLLFKTACVFSFHVKTIALNDSRAAFAVYINGQKKVGTGTDQFGNIGLVAVDNETDVSISIPNTATVISFGGWSYTGQVEISKLQLEFGNTATSYEAPFSHTYPLSDIELRGIPKLVNNELQYDGDTYESSGQVTRKYGYIEFDGSSDEAWSFVAFGNQYRAYIALADIDTSTADTSMANILSNQYNAIPYSAGASAVGISGRSGIAQVNVFQGTYTTLTAWKTHLASNPLTVVYELATPTTETTDSFTNPQQAGSTEEYIDTRTVSMPVGHATEYFNMEQKERIQMHMPTHSPIKMHMEG